MTSLGFGLTTVKDQFQCYFIHTIDLASALYAADDG